MNSDRKLAAEYKISKSTISRIVAQNKQYLVSNRMTTNQITKDNLLVQTFREIDAVVFQVFCNFRSMQMEINSNILKKVGLKAAQEISCNYFKATNG